MTLETGQVIDGKYRIVRQLGVGGMGAVYEGENVRIHRKVAIKVLHAAVATKADIVQRFEREAQAAGRIGSKHIVEVLDLGNLPAGDRFMVMEYLDGESLGDRLKRVKQIGPAELAPIMLQVLEGLAAAHEAGIVHRDLKPDNIYLLKPRSTSRPEEFVKLLDFGVSKFSSLDSDMSMTSTGAVMGTPYYLSPEQARGGKVDARSDLYAIGVVLYQCLAGHVPFQADSFNELLFKIALESPRPLGHIVAGIDPTLVAIVERGMARDPSQRFQSAAAMRDALLAWAQSGAAAMAGLRTTGGGPAMSPALAASLAASGAGHATPAFQQSGGPFQQSGGPLQQSGGPFQQSGGPFQQSGGPFQQSGGPLGQSGGSFGQSGGPLGQSGGPLGQSGGPFGQSGGPLGQSGGPLGQSGGAMAVTSPQPRRSPIVALVAGVVVVGCGVGIGSWFAFGGKATADIPAAEAPAASPPAVTGEPADPDPAPTPSSTATADASAHAASSAQPSARAAGSAAPAASAEPAASATTAAAPPSSPGAGKPATVPSEPRPSGGARPSGGSKPAPSGGKPPPSGAGGRVITPTL